MAGGGEVELMAPSLLEVAELYHLVAHDVGVRCETGTHRTQGVFHHIFPVLFVERHHFEGQVELLCEIAAHLDVFLGGAVPLAVVHPDAYVEQLQVMPLFHKAVSGHSAVHSAGNQHGYLHCSWSFTFSLPVAEARLLTLRKASMRLSTASDLDRILWLPLR